MSLNNNEKAKKGNQLKYKLPESPSTAVKKKKEHAMHQRKKELGGNNFEEEQQLIERDRSKTHHHAIIDDIVYSELKKQELDMNEVKETLNKNPKLVNFLEVNLRHMVKFKKQRDAHIQKLDKMDAASNVIIKQLNGQNKGDEKVDLNTIPFSEMTTEQQLQFLREKFNIPVRKPKINQEVEQSKKTVTGNNNVVLSESLLSNDNLFLTYKRRKLVEESNNSKNLKQKHLETVRQNLLEQIKLQKEAKKQNFQQHSDQELKDSDHITGYVSAYHSKTNSQQITSKNNSNQGSARQIQNEINSNSSSQRIIQSSQKRVSHKNSIYPSISSEIIIENTNQNHDMRSYNNMISKGQNLTNKMRYQARNASVSEQADNLFENNYYENNSIQKQEFLLSTDNRSQKFLPKPSNKHYQNYSRQKMQDILTRNLSDNQVQISSPKPQSLFDVGQKFIQQSKQNRANIAVKFDLDKQTTETKNRSKTVSRQRYRQNLPINKQQQVLNEVGQSQDFQVNTSILNFEETPIIQGQYQKQQKIANTFDSRMTKYNTFVNKNSSNHHQSSTFFSQRKAKNESISVYQNTRQSQSQMRGALINKSFNFNNQSLIDTSQNYLTDKSSITNIVLPNESKAKENLIHTQYNNFQSHGSQGSFNQRNQIHQFLNNLKEKPPNFSVNMSNRDVHSQSMLTGSRKLVSQANNNFNQQSQTFDTSQNTVKNQDSSNIYTNINNATFISNMKNTNYSYRSQSTNRLQQKFTGRTPSILNDQDFREHIKSHPLRWQLNKNQKNIEDKRNEQIQVIHQILEKCQDMKNKGDIELQECEYKQLEGNLKFLNFQNMSDTIKDIEFADSNTLKVLYQYKQQSKHENEDNALEVQKEYKSGIMDPSRVAAQFEKLMCVKKLVGKKKVIQENEKNHKQLRELRGLLSLC
eukprot:403342536